MPASPSAAGTAAGTATNQGEGSAVQASIAAFLVSPGLGAEAVSAREMRGLGVRRGSHRVSPSHGTTFGKRDAGGASI